MIRSALDWNARFHATSRTAFLAVFAAACSLTAVAQISPSTNALLNVDASTDVREDERPQLASDGMGNWVAVWDGQDVGGSPTGTDLDIFVSRSTDAGVTWSPQAPLNTNSDTDFGDDLRPALSTDNAGKWLAVWYSNHDLGGISGTDFDIFYAISTDAGLTWTAPALLNSNATTDSGDDEIPKVATDGANQWVVVWNSNENLGGITGGDYDVFVARSSNGGASWTAPALLNSNGTVDGEDDVRTELISDGLGNWVVAWSSGATLGAPTGGDLDIFVSRSSDNGATWAAASRIDSNDIDDSGDDQRPALATDGLGNWVAAWHSNDNLDGITDGDWDIFTSHSTDNGATWTTGALLNANGGSDTGVDEFVRVTTDTAGNWIAIWDSSEDLGGVTGTDFDILFAKSTDAGLTWSAPALFNTSGTTDAEFDLVAQATTDRAGNWIGVWESNDTLPGAIGTDFDIHYARFTLDPDLTATTIVPATTGPTNAASVSFDVSFRYDTKNFNNASDLVITHSGTENSGVSISGGPRNYTVDVTGLSGEGTFTLAVSAASDVQSLIGNPLVSSVTSAAVSIERVPPTIVLNSAAGDPVAGAISVTATLSEASTNFTSGDVTPTNATLSDFSGSGTSYSFTLTPNSEGSFGAVVNADTFTDAIGNGNIASNAFARTADLSGPAVTLSSASAIFVNGAISADVSLTESSTNFVAGDVSVSNATVSDFAGSGTSYSFTLTPNAEGAFSAVVNAAVLSDALGNPNSGSNTLGRTADFTPPTAMLSTSAGNPVNGAISVEVLLSEASVNFSAGDVSTANATLSGFSGSGTAYSFTLTPDAEGVFDATIGAGAFTDAASNENTASNTLSRSADFTAPTVVLSSLAANPVNGAIAVTTELSESSVNFTSADLAPTNATVSGFSGSGTSYSFTLTPSSEAVFGVSVGASAFTDAAGNVNPASNTLSRTADLTGPTVVISSVAANPTNAAITVDVNLSEVSTDFVAGDVTLSNASLSGFSGSGTSYSFTLTPSSDGSFGASVDAGTLGDALGNANTASNMLSRTADTVAPAVSMSSTEPDPTNVSPIAVTVSFNEAVSGFTVGDITPSNASVSNFAGSGADYSFDLTPSGEGSVTANIAGAVAIDAAGNANSAALQFSRIYDSVLPSVSMSSVSANPTNLSPIAVTVSFDEPVTGFVAGDVLTSNASVSNFTGSGADYSFDLTPSGQGTVTADIEPAVAVDAAGNANTAAPQFTRSFDTIAPTISLSSAAGDPVNGAIAISVTLSDSSVNFATGDVSLTNATLSNFSGSGTSYSFTLTPVAEGSFGASVDAATFTDAAGNTNTASNVLSRSADFSTPSVTLSSASASFVNGAISVAVSLSAVSTDFAEGDVTLVNGTLSGFSGSGTSYSFTLTPNAEGVFSASVDAGTFTNAAGNPNTASNTLSRTADLTAPGVSISSTATDPTNLSSIPVTLSFDEPVTGFNSGDISATNATVNNFSGSGASYTFDLVPSGEGTVTADIAAAVAADTATNANTAASQFSRTYDSVAPTVLLSSAASDPVNGAISVSVTLSSPSTDFASGDLSLTNATASSFSGSGDSYSFTLTPIGEGTMSVSVAGGAFTDAANNGNTASNTLSRTVDLTAPTVSMSSAAPNPTGLSSIPVTVTFSKSVIGFTSSDISAGNATVSAFSGSGASYSFNLVPASGGTVTANISAAVCTDAAGNANTAAAQFSRDYGVPPVITAINDLTIYDGSSYSVTPTLSQGSGTLTWSLIAPGSPPTNMAINASTGRVTWTASLAFSPVDVTISVSGPGGSDTESWRIDVRPSIWVDFAYTGVEIGSPAQPFNTLGEAVSAAVSGDAIQIKGNTAKNFTLETGTLSKPLIIDSSNGTIRVGGNFGGARSLSSGAAPAPTQGATGFVSRSRRR